MRWCWKQGLIAVGIIGCVEGAAAEQVVTVPDTVLRQGQQVALPIVVQLQLSEQSSSLRLVILYAARRLRLLGVRANPEGYPCSALEFRDTLLSADTGRVEVLCSNPPSDGYSGVFAWLELEVLAGQDTVAWLQPTELWSGSTALPLRARTGWIRIAESPPVEPVGVDGLWLAIPSPFASELQVQYAVARPGWVFFRLFAVNGRDIAIEPSAVYAPRAGTYTLRLRFVPWELASGTYLIRMETERGTVSFLRVLCVK